jgi:hypothetical protein
MGNASVKAYEHGHGHNHTHYNTRRHTKRFRRTRHHKHHRHHHRNNRGGALTPSNSVTRKIRHSRPGFNKSVSVGRTLLSGKAKEAYEKSKQHALAVKVNAAEGSKVFSGKRTPKKPVAKMAAFAEEDEE